MGINPETHSRTSLVFEKSLLEKLRQRAKLNKRSLNAEISYTLEKIIESEESARSTETRQ